MMSEFEIDTVDNGTYNSFDDYADLFNSTPQPFSSRVYNGTERDNLTRYDVVTKRDPLYILIPITVIYAVILLTGLVGNVSTCVVIARNRHMHTATNYYLFSLAVSDLLLLVSGLPQEMYYIWWRGYPDMLGETVCVLQGFAAETSANATVLTITAFTVERYVAICHPFQSHTFSKLSRAVRLVVLIWLVALGLAVPQAIQFGVLQRKAEDGTEVALCTVTSELVQHAFEISTLVFFVAPMTLITVLYALIGLKLRRSRLLPAAKRASVGSSSTDKGNDCAFAGKGSSPQNYVIRMLVAVVVAFFICWAPFHAQRLLAVYARANKSDSPVLLTVYKTLTYTSGVLYYLSTTVNPVLYHIMSHKFREAFKSTLADPCGYNRKASVTQRRPTCGVLRRQQTSRHMSLQQNCQLQGHRNSSDDPQKHLLTPSFANTEQQKSARNETRQQAYQQRNRRCSGDDEEQSFALIERRLHGRPAESSVDTIMSCSLPTYVHRPMGWTNSGQTTVTTSLGKLSLKEGSNSCHSKTALPVSEETTARDGSLTINGNCKLSKLDPLVTEDCKIKIFDDIAKYTEGKNSIISQERRKLKCHSNCVEPPRRNSITVITNRLKAVPHAGTIGVLAKKLSCLPLHGNAKIIITAQHKTEQQHGTPGHVSADSAKSTISNSSLQDLDETEFIGSELAHYMGQLNQQRLVH